MAKFDRYYSDHDPSVSEVIFKEFKDQIEPHLQQNLDTMPIATIKVHFNESGRTVNIPVFDEKDTADVYDNLENILKHELTFQHLTISEYKHFIEVLPNLAFSRNRDLVISRTKFLKTITNISNDTLEQIVSTTLKNQTINFQHKPIMLFSVRPINSEIIKAYINYREVYNNYLNSNRIASYPIYIFNLVSLPGLKLCRSPAFGLTVTYAFMDTLF